MQHHIIKSFAVIALGAMLLAGCKQKEEQKQMYEPEDSFGMEEIEAIAQDTTHYRAIIFTSPYCYGCRQMNERTLEAVSAMDTSLWRVYYLIVEDLVDSAHWEDVVKDMTDQGVDRNLIHHCSLPLEGIAKILPLFRSFTPVDYKYPHIPTELLVDTNNYLAIEKTMDKSDTAVFWYDLRSLNEYEVTEHTDYSVDDGVYSVVDRKPPKEDHIVVVNR